MTPQEQALQSWRQQRINYEKCAQRVISDLKEITITLPSPAFDSKLQELKQYLKYNYIYEEEEMFLEVYVHFIAGRKNISVMQLSNKLVEEIGGTNKFWQNKITDIGMYVCYHPELSIWEVNIFYEKYLGIPPQNLNHIRKKKSLAKKYLSYLTGICKLIDKAKPFEEDLLKIDDFYLKVKRSEEEYYAYLNQIQNRDISSAENASTKGILNAKKNLFLFLKPKEVKSNTLLNYNFKCRKSNERRSQSKMLKRSDYEQFDQILKKLKDKKSSVSTRKSRKSDFQQISDLRKQFKKTIRPKEQSTNLPQNYPVFIWSKQFYFSYWGFIVDGKAIIDYTSPYTKYEIINYQIDSQEQFDELLAEDVDINQSQQEISGEENQNSFVVSDYHESDQEEELRIKNLTQNYFKDRWIKLQPELQDYQLITFENLPLSIEALQPYNAFIEKFQGLTRNQIIDMLDKNQQNYSKAKLDLKLKSDFVKKRSKKGIIYMRKGEESKDKQDTTDIQTSSQVYEISVSYAFRPKISEIVENKIEAALEDSQVNSNSSN